MKPGKKRRHANRYPPAHINRMQEAAEWAASRAQGDRIYIDWLEKKLADARRDRDEARSEMWNLRNAIRDLLAGKQSDIEVDIAGAVRTVTHPETR